MSAPDGARQRQRCRTLVFAAALGVVLATISVVDRAWPGIVAGIAGAIVVVILYRRECAGARASGTPPSGS